MTYCGKQLPSSGNKICQVKSQLSMINYCVKFPSSQGPHLFLIDVGSRDLNIQCHKLIVSTTNRSNNNFTFYESYLLYKNILIIRSLRYFIKLYTFYFYIKYINNWACYRLWTFQIIAYLRQLVLNLAYFAPWRW